ncbi:YjfB family protein [Acidovorax sp. SUPP950]|uniref:YjfB family protein n=1 Tax=unclassified Acidovorax TaxID=2684926 RepID=UPI0023498F87|nr:MULTISPECIES: YjfB family protein [Comamonadaceae]WCM99889.1 YjfB family protein [Acidovorax sp. GBBC 1281]WOI46906.1 YjfB family protein [Paracidovorax avenae]GKS73473.1 YjfB family protein [Acidovorax sp. SUPP950]GKS84676.1 YjfB family protein [Acidovorax sp. SUPP1855]GKS96367.1 YjfB family protein [Acidovorax sp. SUPP2825]
MDVALSQSVVNTATAMASQKNSDALNIRVLKKALDTQEASATLLIESMKQSMPQPALATSGALGTQVNTFA